MEMNKKGIKKSEGFFSLNALLSQKKGFEEQGTEFNVKMIVAIIFFIVVVALVAALLWWKLSPQQAAGPASSFGTYIWDILGGGK